MPLNLADLKKNSSSSLEALSEQLSKITAPQYNNSDERIWYPDVDKSGNGYAVIRFLDAPKGEDVPFVRYWEHRFKGPTGSWYVEKCLTTLGKDDPVAQRNNVLWNTGLESDKAIAREQKRNLIFLSNILVIKDPAKPENEGKVFLFKYGKKIYDKLNDQMNPPGGEDKVNPFDFWKGANFKMKIRTVEGYRNYDMSSFDSPSPLSQDDDQIELIWKQQYPLQPFVDEKSFKTYEELKAKLDHTLCLNKQAAAVDLPAQAAPSIKKASNVASLPATEEDLVDDDEEGEDDFKKRLKLFEQIKKDAESN